MFLKFFVPFFVQYSVVYSRNCNVASMRNSSGVNRNEIETHMALVVD